VEWRPIDPVVANVGYSGIVARAPHPHAALLFIDYLHSNEGQQFVVKGGLSSHRNDVESLVPQKFQKTYLEAKYSLDEYEKKLEEWEDLIQKLLIKKDSTVHFHSFPHFVRVSGNLGLTQRPAAHSIRTTPNPNKGLQQCSSVYSWRGPVFFWPL
jgi:hypothetical protein